MGKHGGRNADYGLCIGAAFPRKRLLFAGSLTPVAFGQIHVLLLFESLSAPDAL